MRRRSLGSPGWSISAGWAFATKAATGGGLLIAGLVLQIINFPATAEASAASAAAVPAEIAAALALAGGPGAALLALLGTGLVMFYRVDRKAHAKIIAALIARRGV